MIDRPDTRDERVRAPLEEATFVASDSIRYLRPELVLMMKARLRRPEDERDLAAVLPQLDVRARARLRELPDLLHPGHPWLTAVAEALPPG